MRLALPLSIAWLAGAALAGAAPAPAPAQLLPQLPAVPLGGLSLPPVGEAAEGALGRLAATAERLDQARRDAIARLVREHPRSVALDPDGAPARAGEVVLDDPDAAVLATAQARGYRVIERGDVLGIGFARLAVPDGRTLKAAIADIRALGGAVSADTLHRPSGSVDAPGVAASGGGTLVGVIDGGVPGAALHAGFAAGAPRASDHAVAVASLIAGAPGVRGALSDARIASADVYGTDPAGGNATAIAKAIGWLVQQRVGVACISLVGPPHPLLARVVAAARARGLVIVAAVGNDGPAAPPAYPASYPGVIAVTGVDGRDRALIEAGRAAHLDYAAPGADMLAARAAGRPIRVRGTSFAAPLAAAVIARHYPAPAPAALDAALGRVDRTAKRLGNPRIYGRGLLCADCRTAP